MPDHEMLEIYFLENSEQIHAIADSLRWRMLNLLIAQPMTGSQLARGLNIPRSLSHYHLKKLEKVGLIKLVEERTHNHLIERYYQAVAKSFRTDQLLSKARQSLNADTESRQTGEALYDIIRSMLTVVEVDISNPSVRHNLIQMNYHYQEDVKLTKKQYQRMAAELRRVADLFIECDQSNQSTPPDEELLNFRYTLLVTPAISIDLEQVTNQRKLK